MGLLDKIFGKDEKTAFAIDFQQALKNAGDPRLSEFDPGEFRLVFEEDGEQQGVLNLGNLFDEYKLISKEERKDCLSEMVRAALSHFKQMPDEFEAARYDVRPRLWTRSTLEQIRLRQLATDERDLDWPLEPLGDHLCVSFVYDLPESVRSISNDDLRKWDVTYWHTREIAFRNLVESESAFASVGNELYASSTGDSYDATRIVLVEMIRGLEIKGQPIAMVPNRDTLLLTGTESEVGQKMMLEFATMQLAEQPRPMIATPLILGMDDEWHDWIPPDDHPFVDEFRKLRLGWFGVEYAEQKQLIEKINDKNHVDEFVSAYTVISKKNRLLSYCVWSRDVPSLLPHSDLVALLDTQNPSPEPKFVRLDDLLTLACDSLEPTDYYPARYRVCEYPNADLMDQLQAVDI